MMIMIIIIIMMIILIIIIIIIMINMIMTRIMLMIMVSTRSLDRLRGTAEGRRSGAAFHGGSSRQPSYTHRA